MRLPGDYDPDTEKGMFTDADERQIQELLNLLPSLKGDCLQYLEWWVESEVNYGYWHKAGFPTGVDWFIDYLRDTE